MKDSDNVVSLQGVYKERREAKRASSLPASVTAVRDKAQALLAEQAKLLFAKVDDSLFAMAEKAHGQDEQDGLFQALRLLRVERRKVVERFADNIGQAFHVRETSADEKDDPYSADNLSLVHNDDLEQLVAVDTMVASAKRDFAEPLTEISLRLNTLLSVKIYDKNNPVGPDAICDAFVEACRPLEMHVRARLTLLKKFEQHVMANLGNVYDHCNDLLVEHGVLPSLKQQRRAARQQRPVPQGPTPQSPGAQGGQPSGSTQATYSSAGSTPASGHGLVPLGSGVAPMPAHDLLSHLGALQSHLPNSYEGGEIQLLNINSLLQQRLVDVRQSASLTKMDSDIIKLVEMLFSFILEDRNLAEPIKTQLGRLQLPLLKVAIADKSFFSKGGHPARKLLNELADAATGWQAKDRYESDPLFKKTSEVVARVLSEFDQDINIFSTLLESFREFILRERKRAEKLERRIVDEADGKAKTQAARARVAAVMDALMAERDLPPVVSEWLEKVWSNMLFLTCIKEGTDSESWSRDVRTARDLVWSVHAPMPDSRKQLLGLLPTLQERLKAGVEAVSLNTFDARRMFTGLKEVYRERFALAQRITEERSRKARDEVREEVRSKQAEAVTSQVERPAAERAIPEDTAAEQVQRAEPVVELPQMEELEQVVAEAELAVEASGDVEALPENDLHWQQTFRLAQGSWFELKRGDEEQFRCRLAAVIKDIDQFIFVNRNGAKVAEFTRIELAHALRNAQLMPLDDGMLFERALQSVIGTVRKSRGEMS
ncbi:DUF1631 domain-containing protein [Microbulbifer hydrolyticus]|uniref:DUF1631 family protein n=1 Tax=Microbulbifer hydrolyticus TaxID=48074 RepID=A0A6P1T9Z1_9GAMM|nr:DUF1631 domain-containing protein [Microbulbifer hydrolyticus]MBB5213269.1 hypothetical protein [Microbulbifer hydrolyticus]QHQ38565.1 DUF1631 family protein [Microbulbifer hydrolyticus]